MTAFNLSSRIQKPLRTLVYVRKAIDMEAPLINGEDSGWTLAPNLRCNWVKRMVGPRVAQAAFDFVPLAIEEHAFEVAAAAFGIDDQVRVVALPLVDELAAEQPETDSEGYPIFEGVLTRPNWTVKTQGGNAGEVVEYHALALPAAIDNVAAEHLITGRWVGFPGEDPTLALIDSPFAPPVANFRGLPNRHASAYIEASAGFGSFQAPVFARGGEDDPAAVYWSVRDFIASILAMWLYGPAGDLNRHVDLDLDTLEALIQPSSGEGAGDRPAAFIGFDDRCPEVSVYGLGVFDALHAVCEAAGFAFAIEPVKPDETYADRREVLRIWRKGAGTFNFFDLAPRGSTFADVQATIAANNVETFSGMRDGERIVNTVVGAGRVLVESIFPLRPLWNPAHVSNLELSADMQDDNFSSLYHTAHVVDRPDFDEHGHVGRRWGLDCVGGFQGYTTPSDWQHEADGFDFVEWLALNSEDAQVFDRVDAMDLLGQRPIVWSRRVRRILPLRGIDATVRGLKYQLYVSENSGANYVPVNIRFSTLPDFFGIWLHVRNLASVNSASLHTKTTPDVEDSWWAGIRNGTLRFAIYCAVEADNALRADAIHQTRSGSRYSKAQLIAPDIEDVWRVTRGVELGLDAEPNGFLRPVTDEIRNSALNAFQVLGDATIRRRDALEQARLTCFFRTWVMDLFRYRLGERIQKVRGREFSLATSHGGDDINDDRYPNIVAITYRLGVNDQSIELHLEDEAVTGGTV